jgi:hypothetical protein
MQLVAERNGPGAGPLPTLADGSIAGGKLAAGRARRAARRAGASGAPHMPETTVVARMVPMCRTPFTVTVSPFLKAESFACMESRLM